jgi:hypothetical protein
MHCLKILAWLAVSLINCVPYEVNYFDLNWNLMGAWTNFVGDER